MLRLVRRSFGLLTGGIGNSADGFKEIVLFLGSLVLTITWCVGAVGGVWERWRGVHRRLQARLAYPQCVSAHTVCPWPDRITHLILAIIKKNYPSEKVCGGGTTVSSV